MMECGRDSDLYEGEFIKYLNTNYTDEVLNNKILNEIVVRLEQANIFLFNNFCNMNIRNSDNKNSIRLRSQSLKGSLIIKEPFNEAKKVIEKENFKLSARNEVIFHTILLFQWISALLLCSTISITKSKKFSRISLSQTNTFINVKTDLCLYNLEFGLDKQTNDQYIEGFSYPLSSNSTYDLEEYARQKYSSFCLWLARDIPAGVWTYLLFPIKNDLLAFQVTINLALTMCLCYYIVVGSILYPIFQGYQEIRAPLFLFLYKPKLVVQDIHSKCLMYIRLLNVSFKRYELEMQTFTLGDKVINENKNLGKSRWSTSDITFHFKNGYDRRRSNKITTNLIENNQNDLIDERDFKFYIPLNRTNGWRRFTLVYHSILMTFIASSGAALGFAAYIFSGLGGVPITKLNQELKLSLIALQDTKRLEVRDTFMVWLTDELYNFVNSNLNLNISNGDRILSINEKAKIIGDMISPYEILPQTHLIWPLISTMIDGTAFWAATFLCMFCVFIVDLIIWVLMLQIKLNICNVLLNYYELSSPIPQQQPYSSICGSIRSPRSLEQYQVSSNQISHKGFKKVRVAVDKADQSWDNKNPLYLDLNLSLWDVFEFLLVNRRKRDKIATDFAFVIIDLDRKRKGSGEAFRKFLVETYLDFRLFRDQIESSKETIDAALAIAAIQSPVVLICCICSFDWHVRAVIMSLSASYMIAILIGVSFFQSQSSKLSGPISSFLAYTVRSKGKIQFIAQLWRKGIRDLHGSQSLFNFKFLSINMTYATSIEVNFPRVSLYR